MLPQFYHVIRGFGDGFGDGFEGGRSLLQRAFCPLQREALGKGLEALRIVLGAGGQARHLESMLFQDASRGRHDGVVRPLLRRFALALRSGGAPGFLFLAQQGEFLRCHAEKEKKAKKIKKSVDRVSDTC